MEQLLDMENPLNIGDEDLIAISAASSSGNRSQTEVENAGVDLSFSRNGSFSRLNASAPEFVPRSPSPVPSSGHPRIVKIHHHPPPPTPVIHVFHPPQPPPSTVNPQFIPPGPPIGVYEYYGGAIGGGGFGDLESAQAPVDSDSNSPARDTLPEDVVHKITKQVEYYFSDANLSTTEHLMRFISKDPDGFVPITVVASFKKIKALVHNNLLLANALRASSKLVVSDDGKKVRRLHPFTEADVEELQSRIVVAENLPEDHSYQNLMKIFSASGSVKTIRTCYPQTPNGSTAPTNRSSKLDMLFCNKLHAFVEYESVEDAERAVADVSKERSWRSGLRLRLLNKCIAKHASIRGRKIGNDADIAGEDEEVYAANLYIDKQPEDGSQQAETSFEFLGIEEGEGGGRRGKARGRGRGRGRSQHHGSSSHHRGGSSHGHGHGQFLPNSTQTLAHPIHIEQSAVPKQPPGPRMPDGTRGFSMGRGKANFISSSTAAAG